MVEVQTTSFRIQIWVKVDYNYKSTKLNEKNQSLSHHFGHRTVTDITIFKTETLGSHESDK